MVRNFTNVAVLLCLRSRCRVFKVPVLRWSPAEDLALVGEATPDPGEIPTGTTMTEEVIDPGLLEQTKNQIRKLVAEIADLAESDIQPNEFYVEFLNRSVAAVAATGGAFWMMDGRGGLRLQYQVEFGVTGMMDGRVKTAPHDALLGCMLQATQAQNHSAERRDRGSSAGVQPDRTSP